ncbi:MAG: YHS domain-containing (seleno)protein [Pseudomonadota bacterium]
MLSTVKKLVAVAAVASVGAFAATASHASNQLATAIGGYDTVSYFTDAGPQMGKAKFHHFWNGAVWFFATAENRDAFKADPTAFAPAHAPKYDGYCAWAASQNYKRPGDPNVWQIVDNRLYLFVHEGARDKWLADVPTYISQADANWEQIAPY